MELVLILVPWKAADMGSVSMELVFAEVTNSALIQNYVFREFVKRHVNKRIVLHSASVGKEHVIQK